MFQQETDFRYKDKKRLKVEGQKTIFYANSNQPKEGWCHYIIVDPYYFVLINMKF